MLSILPDAVVTTTARPVTINVLANDTGDALTITSFSKPANGSLVFNADKSFTYTPAGGFVGDDGFSYTVRDGQGTPASIEVTISVLPDDGATVATDDIVEVVAAGDVIIPVLANDMVAGDGSLRISAVSVPGYGAVNVLPDQTIRYVPQSDFVGIDSFNYTIFDEAGRSATATVIVKVVAINSEPLAVSDTFTIEVGTTTILAILSNDSDSDGGPLQVVGFTMPSHGELVFNPDKTFTYTPDAGYQGPDQFSYTIRDGQGASAAASVALDVVEMAESAIALDDRFTTTAGAPVTIDVLANDTLPAERSTMIVAVTLPFKGRLTFNPDKTIIYIPNAGFVGTDDFTYTIGSGKGDTSKATVTVEVMAASSVDVYANGYAHRRRLAIPVSSAKGSSHENFPLWVELTGSWLKSTDNGGKVVSLEGHDLRFELADGTSLAHELEHYDPVNGKLGAWVRLPELHADQPTVLLLYYGKAGLAESAADPQAVWQDYLAVWHLPGTSDRSGQGRDLVALGDVQTAALGLGASSVALNGDAVLQLDDTSWLAGLDALSVQLRSKADAVGHDRGQLNVGAFGRDRDADLSIRYQATGFADPQPTNVLHCKLATSGQTAAVSSGTGTQTTDWQSITFAWQAGDQRPALHLDGLETAATFETGGDELTQTDISGPLVVGAGPRDTIDGGWVGLIDEVRFRATKLDPAWINAEHINHSNPARFFGIGGEESLEDDFESLVAVPIDTTTSLGEWLDLDVVAAALLPAGVTGATIQSITQPANGSASVTGGKVRYSPAAGFSGHDSFTYQLTANGKTSTGLITIAVGVEVVRNEDTLPAATRILEVATTSQLNNALANAQPGDHIVLADGSYAAPNRITRSGTAQEPIVIRAANLLGARITSGTIEIDASWITWHGIDSVANGAIRLGANAAADDVKIWRCRWRDKTSGSSQAVRTYNAKRTDFAYCEWTNWKGTGLLLGITSGTRETKVRYCLFRDTPAGWSEVGAEAIRTGFGSRGIDSNILIYRCKVRNWNGDSNKETIKLSHSSNVVRQCVQDDCDGFLSIRGGQNNTLDSCWSKSCRGIGVHDGYLPNRVNKIIGCRSENDTHEGILVRGGTVEPGVETNGTHNLAEGCVVSGCNGPIKVAHNYSGHTKKARFTRIREHTGPINLTGWQENTDDGRNQQETLYEWSSLIWLDDSKVGPFADLP